MGLRINKEVCNLCGRCVKECPYGALQQVEGELKVDQRCVLCGACIAVCPVEALSIPIERTAPERTPVDSYRGVWVFGELHEGALHRVVFELIGVGQRLAERRRCPLEVVVLGDGLSEVQCQLAGYPVDRVHLVEHPRLAVPAAEPYARIIADLIVRHRPEIVLAGATSFGRSVIPRVAVLAHTGLTADCTGLDVDEETGNLMQTRPAFGGNIMATILCPDHRPQMATVRPGVMPPAAPQGTRMPSLSRTVPTRQQLRSGTKLLRLVSGTDEAVNIADADVLVAGGRGVGGPEGFEPLRELASALGGAVAASRAAVDAGWIPYAHQVGQTGKTVQPSLYIACGISGSVQHLVGMQASSLIVAINTDADAPIFRVADYGIVGDVREVVPELVRAVRQYRAANEPTRK